MTPSLQDIQAFSLKLGRRNLLVNLKDLLVIGVVLVVFGLLFRFPGSIPPSWPRVDGSVSSVIGKAGNGGTLYYPVVQYLALGYSHDVNSRQGYSYYPALGTPYKVAFDPQEPESAKLVSDSNRNYFALLPWLGLAAVATSSYRYLRTLRRHHIDEDERMASVPEPAAIEAAPEETEPVVPAEATEPALPTEAGANEAETSEATPEAPKPAKAKPKAKKKPAKGAPKTKPKTTAKTLSTKLKPASETGPGRKKRATKAIAASKTTATKTAKPKTTKPAKAKTTTTKKKSAAKKK